MVQQVNFGQSLHEVYMLNMRPSVYAFISTVSAPNMKANFQRIINSHYFVFAEQLSLEQLSWRGETMKLGDFLL